MPKLAIAKNETSGTLYSELYNRNFPIIDLDIQNKIKALNLVVAGCGSTGGAFLDGAIRLGVSNFRICDNGSYELNNLNRQMVTTHEITQNKSAVYAQKLKSVNPQARVESFSEGLTRENVDHFLQDASLVFDAVDVTTRSGMEMKLLLHERAALRRLPVASALDLGFTQWIRSFDYRENNDPLFGKLNEARNCSNPILALLKGFVSIDELPLEILDEVERLLENQNASACQLGSACFLLSALVTPYLIHYLRENSLPKTVSVDLLRFFPGDQQGRETRAREKRAKLRTLLGL